MPALSCSAIASSTARSSAARSSSAPIVPSRAASLASRRYSGRSRLPTTSARTTVVLVAMGASFGRWDSCSRAYKVATAHAGRGRQESRSSPEAGAESGSGWRRRSSRAGMRVAIADVRADHLEAATAELGGDVHAIQLDVTDRDAFARAADETERVLGNVHVLCNNAGINLFNDIADATYQDWDWVLGVNLGGVVNGVVTFVPRIKAHGEGGHVVNTASMAAFVAGPGAGIYTTAKFAVHGLSDALRWSLLPHGIGVSMVCPGLVKSKIYESDLIRPAELSTDVTPADAGVHAHPAGPARGRDATGGDRREGPARDQAERLLRLHAPRAPRGAAGDLRRDDRRVPRRAGAGGPARGRGGPARRQRRARSPPGRATECEEVEGRTAFVTGGASGIGLGMATAFVARG